MSDLLFDMLIWFAKFLGLSTLFFIAVVYGPRMLRQYSAHRAGQKEKAGIENDACLDSRISS